MRNRNLSDQFLYFYARGYFDARTDGTPCVNEHWHEQMRVPYKEGYDRGIHDYCRENHPEDEEV